ncbi:MAG: OmpH family outer membrane protein [Pyrinomonadaceae bacterium]
MKRVSRFTLSIVFAAVFSVTAFGQAAAQPSGKIGWIDTQSFASEKGGVTRYVAASKALDGEFKPRVSELEGLQTKIASLAKEIQAMQGNAAVPVNQQTLLAKQDEGQRLQREGEFKKKEFEAAYQARMGQVLGPITADIGKAIQDFAKQKGYSVVLDIAALANASAILVLDPSADLTKEFIIFYNARPATTATTAVPK